MAEERNTDIPQVSSHHGLVKNWYEKFDDGHYIAPEGKSGLTPDVISDERLHLKMDLIAEEFIELVEAVYGEKSGNALKMGWVKSKLLDEGNRDIIEAADATGDLDFVLQGFNLETGIPADKVFDEIYLSNMSKLDPLTGKALRSDGTDGKPKGKILKGDDWFEPDLQAIIDGTTPDRTPFKQINLERK